MTVGPLAAAHLSRPGPDRDWRDDALCRGLPIEVFFPQGRGRHADFRRAEAICSFCPVMRECRAENDRLESRTGELYGYVGGESPRQRVARRRAERKGLVVDRR